MINYYGTWAVPNTGRYLFDAANGKVLGVVDGQLAWVAKA